MATCKECLHFEVCRMHYRQKCELAYDTQKEVNYAIKRAEKGSPICEHFKDRSRFVELPCKLGDTVYIALNEYGVLKDTVKEFRITSKRIWIRPEKFGMDCLLENMAFLTHEAAEQALKERELTGEQLK